MLVPAVLFPAPTTTLTLPATPPPADRPVFSTTAPLLPFVVLPVDADTKPLTPLLPPSAEWMLKAPLEVARP